LEGRGECSLPVGAFSVALALLTFDLLKKNINIARFELSTAGNYEDYFLVGCESV
jgi:hypothetical protein